MTDEQLKNLQKWHDALLSGKYKQGKGRLLQENEQGDLCYCCLGVACDVMGVEAKKIEDSVFYSFSKSSMFLPKEVGMLLGILDLSTTTNNTRTQLSIPSHLQARAKGQTTQYPEYLNDNFTFEEIAECLRETYPQIKYKRKVYPGYYFVKWTRYESPKTAGVHTAIVKALDGGNFHTIHEGGKLAYVVAGSDLGNDMRDGEWSPLNMSDIEWTGLSSSAKMLQTQIGRTRQIYNEILKSQKERNNNE